MSCCGKKRTEFQGTIQTHQGFKTTGSTHSQPQSVRHSAVYFQYLGKTGLTVVGSITSKRYSFNSPGAIVEVDLRDRPAMTAVPNLRQVRNL